MASRHSRILHILCIELALRRNIATSKSIEMSGDELKLLARRMEDKFNRIAKNAGPSIRKYAASIDRLTEQHRIFELLNKHVKSRKRKATEFARKKGLLQDNGEQKGSIQSSAIGEGNPANKRQKLNDPSGTDKEQNDDSQFVVKNETAEICPETHDTKESANTHELDELKQIDPIQANYKVLMDLRQSGLVQKNQTDVIAISDDSEDEFLSAPLNKLMLSGREILVTANTSTE